MRIVPWTQASSSAAEPVLPVAVISLTDQQERRRLLIERGIPAGWLEPYWPATDLRKAEADELAAFVDVQAYPHFSGEPLRAAVVGCATSHRRLAQWLAATKHPLLLVLEDDVVPSSTDLIRAVIDVAEQLWPAAKRGQAFVCHLGSRPEQLQLSLRRPLKLPHPLHEGRHIWCHIDPRPTIWRAHAYLLSRGAALRSVAKESLMCTVADNWIRRRDLGLIDRLYLTDPRLFGQDETLPSTLGIRPTPLPVNVEAPWIQRGATSLRFRSRMLKARLLHNIPFRLELRSR